MVLRKKWPIDSLYAKLKFSHSPYSSYCTSAILVSIPLRTESRLVPLDPIKILSHYTTWSFLGRTPKTPSLPISHRTRHCWHTRPSVPEWYSSPVTRSNREYSSRSVLSTTVPTFYQGRQVMSSDLNQTSVSSPDWLPRHLKSFSFWNQELGGLRIGLCLF